MMSPLDPETLASLHIEDLLHDAGTRALAREARSTATRPLPRPFVGSWRASVWRGRRAVGRALILAGLWLRQERALPAASR